MEGYLAIHEGNSPGARLMRANFEQIREEAVQAGYITNDEVKRRCSLCSMMRTLPSVHR